MAEFRLAVRLSAAVIWGGLAMPIASAPGVAAAGQPNATSVSRPTAESVGVAQAKTVLKRYCISCHNARQPAQGLSLEELDPADVSVNAIVWEKVIRKLRTRAMPPVGLLRPDELTYDSVASTLEQQIDTRAAASPNPGRTETFHRLNRVEYRNAIRDVLDVDIDVSALLPADDVSNGFDNMGGLNVSSTLLEGYLSAARAVAGVAVATSEVAPAAEVYRVRSDFSQRTRNEDSPLGTRGGTTIQHTFPVDAEYIIGVALARAGSNARQQLEISIDGVRLQLVSVGGESTPELRWRFPIRAGRHEIAATFLMKTSAAPDGLFEPATRREADEPGVVSVTITGPFSPSGATDTPSRRRIFTCHPEKAAAQTACARQILSRLARAAYRRPVSEADVRLLWPFYEDGQSAAGFEVGIERAIRRMLVSPDFLFRIERDPPSGPEVFRVSDLELASRLSFFIWSSIPDEALLDAAVNGVLRTPGGLEQQVSRMLADQRSAALASNFAGQWLFLRNLPATSPDETLFPQFTENLRQDFRRETELFFESLLRENRSVLELLTADYSFLNERLAKHYGVRNVYGSRFRRVTITDPNRRGLLGQGSFLTVTSHPDRTSVVGRGKWVLENLLSSPPPPPPPNVPALAEQKSNGSVLTLRERMAQHRENPVCAGCHARMDPIGFALENFDAVGQWRTQEGYRAIDASAQLPGGERFDGPAGLRSWLLNQPAQIATAVTEKLLTYALGRGLEFYDAPTVREITRSTARDEYRLQSLVLGVINSTPFQMRRRDVAPAPETRTEARQD